MNILIISITFFFLTIFIVALCIRRSPTLTVEEHNKMVFQRLEAERAIRIQLLKADKLNRKGITEDLHKITDI
jgi:hypothetical protein